MGHSLHTSGVTVRQIAAEGNVNQAQIVIADVNLNLLEERRLNGTVLSLNDLIRDAYSRVIHFSDNGEEHSSSNLIEVPNPASEMKPGS